jgi:type III pantothenate kinase
MTPPNDASAGPPVGPAVGPPGGLLLCADIGNTHTVIGMVSGTKVHDQWRVATDERRTADEWAVLIRGLVSDSVVADDLNGVAVCSTVPAVLQEWRGMLATRYQHLPQVVVEPGIETGVPVLVDNPREVGADRIVNALAAATLFSGPSIVVDFGTATTFDVVTARGEYVGGAIAPGIAISLEALGRRGAQLRKVELVRPRNVIAKNTVEALQSGMIFGFASQVDGIVTRMAAELGVDVTDVNVIATGGLAPLIASECSTVTGHEPWLTLVGLGLVFVHQRQEGGVAPGR